MGWGLPIHMKMSSISINNRYCTILVSNRALYIDLIALSILGVSIYYAYTVCIYIYMFVPSPIYVRTQPPSHAQAPVRAAPLFSPVFLRRRPYPFPPRPSAGTPTPTPYDFLQAANPSLPAGSLASGLRGRYDKHSHNRYVCSTVGRYSTNIDTYLQVSI